MPERARDLADRGRFQLGATRQAHDRRRAVHRLVAPAERQAVAARVVEHPHRGDGRARADDLEPEPLDRLQRLPPGDEGGEDEVAQRPVLEQLRAHHVAIDGDVAQRPGHLRRDEHGLAGEEVQLAEEAGRAVADDLVARRVEDRDLAVEDRDERVAPGADAVEHVAGGRRALLAELGQPRELCGREHRAVWRRHDSSLAAHLTHRMTRARLSAGAGRDSDAHLGGLGPPGLGRPAGVVDGARRPAA